MTDSSSTTEPRGQARQPRLGELLLNEGVLTRHELDQAIQVQEKEGGFLGEIFVRMGFVKQTDVSSCLVKQCKIPHLSLLDYNIDKDVSELVPRDVCLKYHLLPIDRMGKILTVAMVDPLDSNALHEVREACPELRIKPILCNWHHYELVSSRVFGTKPKAQSSSGGGGGDLTMESLGLGPAPARPKPEPAPAPEPPAPESVQTTPLPDAPAAAADPLDLDALGSAIEQSISHALREAVETLAAEMHQDTESAGTSQPPLPSTDQLAEAMRQSVGEAFEETLAEVIVQLRSMFGQHANTSKENLADALSAALAEHRKAEEEMFRRLFDTFAGNPRQARPVKATPSPGTAYAPEDPITDEFQPFQDQTFDTFVGGKDNEFTLKIGQTVAREPGGKYNPVLIHGKVGAGKTHFLSAIANMMLDNRPESRVALISASRFASAFEEAAREGKAEEFRKRHAAWDMFLLDDIQGFEGRIPALEEFLHLLNVLHQRGAQIIIAGDKAPDALAALGRQAMSRLASGVVAELRPPTWEARVEILRRAAKRESVDIPEEVLKLISMKVPEDMRMMIGALAKVAAMGTLDGQPITYETAENVLKRLGSEVAA